MTNLSRTGFRTIGVCFTVALVAACGGGGTGTSDPEIAAELEAEERAEEHAAHFQDLVTSGDPDPIGALVASMQADPNLTDVQRHDTLGSVIATTTDGVPFGIMVAEMDRPEWRAVTAPPATGTVRASGDFGALIGNFPEAPKAQIACNSTNFPQSKKACILRSTLTAAGAVQDQGIDQSLVKAGFEIAPLNFPTRVQDVITLHQTLSTCGVLYIRAHGGGVPNLEGTLGNHLLTELTGATAAEKEQLKSTFGPSYKKYFGKKTSSRTGKTHLSLSPEFFASVQYPNTLVFTNACGSGNDMQRYAGGSSLPNAFKSKGAGAVVGWKTVVSADMAGKAATEFFAALAPKVVVDGVTINVPPTLGPGQPYTPSATITPASAGVEVSLSVRGTDGFTRDETKLTNAGGTATFTAIPGGAAGVTDDVTVSVGGANDSQAAQNIVQTSPTLQGVYNVSWYQTLMGVTTLGFDANLGFNLVCNNPKITKTATVVKFQSVLGAQTAAPIIRR